MKKNDRNNTIAMIIILAGTVLTSSAQSTFIQVYNLLQSNCTGCHGGATPDVFSLDGNETDVYNAIVNVVPQNNVSAQKGFRLVDPGYPYRSFLLRKIGSSFDDYLALDQGEGALCPKNQASLSDADIELVRQWIQNGAPQNGSVVDYSMLVDYYTNGGLPFIAAPPAPNPSEGFQIRYGPIFLKPGEEFEFMKKEKLENTSLLKAWKLEGRMSIQSHHMMLFVFDDDGSGTREGLRKVPNEDIPFNSGPLTAAWQDDLDFELPSPTAFYWPPNTILDFDYHIKNYSSTEILPNDFYLNVYLDTDNSKTIEMKAQLVNEFVLILPQGIQTRTSTHLFPGDRYIYLLTSHTHKYGIDYDIFALENGGKGEQIYEGFYDVDYTFNQGFYDWEHPANRIFTPLKKVTGGLVYEGKWNIQEPLVTFGLTTDDEMLLLAYIYTDVPLPQATGIEDIPVGFDFNVMPNPFNSTVEVNYAIKESAEVELELFDVIGKSILKEEVGNYEPGSYKHALNISGSGVTSGVYYLSLNVNGQAVETKKLIKF